MERDRFLSAEEAKEFGLIDEVVSERPPEVAPQPEGGENASDEGGDA